MKVLGIVCSPRLHGNTEIMVQESLAGAQERGAEVELVTLVGKTMAPCDGCYSCQKTGVCHIKDDMQDIYAELLEADGIIFGTPVYFWTVSAQAKILIDRTVVLAEARKLRNKVAGVVVTQGREGATSAATVFSSFFTTQGMVMAGYAVGFGGMKEGQYGYEYPVAGVKNDEMGMAQARGLGRAVVRRIQSSKI